jgi:hypothetical protein
LVDGSRAEAASGVVRYGRLHMFNSAATVRVVRPHGTDGRDGAVQMRGRRPVHAFHVKHLTWVPLRSDRVSPR